MRLALIAAALVVAGCNDAGQWENEQHTLDNEANGIVPAPENPNALADTDYFNSAEPAANGAEGTPPPPQ